MYFTSVNVMGSQHVQYFMDLSVKEGLKMTCIQVETCCLCNKTIKIVVPDVPLLYFINNICTRTTGSGRSLPKIKYTRAPYFVPRGGVRSKRGLGPTMTARGQNIGIQIAMLPQTLIMSRLDQLSRLGARIQFFHQS